MNRLPARLAASANHSSHCPLITDRLQNTNCFPSGDHDGWTSSASPEVTWTGGPPLRSMIQISQLPDRSLANAILVPSGLNMGWMSEAGSDVSCVTATPSRLFK